MHTDDQESGTVHAGREADQTEGSRHGLASRRSSSDLAAGLAGLISAYVTNRAATIRELTKNFFSTHTDIDNDPFLPWFERQ